MSTLPRQFRGPESHAAEIKSRDTVAPFLISRGYQVLDDQRIKTGMATQQFIVARAPDGQNLKTRIRLCWRRDGRKLNEQRYSAAQLAAHLRPGGWDATLEHMVERDISQGITHNLLFQREGEGVAYAALIPVEAMHPIWTRQRDISDDLQRRGLKGSIRKNHAQNGTSPTLWLQDDRMPDSHEVADALWQWPGVIDLAKLALRSANSEVVDDTYDDCPASDYSTLGRDQGKRIATIRSEVKRDLRVRLAVLERAKFKCERDGCGESRNFLGFLDVHHVLGAEVSDRVYNCVALCPNCHREAHYSNERDELNRRLLDYAQRYQ